MWEPVAIYNPDSQVGCDTHTVSAANPNMNVWHESKKWLAQSSYGLRREREGSNWMQKMIILQGGYGTLWPDTSKNISQIKFLSTSGLVNLFYLFLYG